MDPSMLAKKYNMLRQERDVRGKRACSQCAIGEHEKNISKRHSDEVERVRGMQRNLAWGGTSVAAEMRGMDATMPGRNMRGIVEHN
jgi:hypothetical protein